MKPFSRIAHETTRRALLAGVIGASAFVMAQRLCAAELAAPTQDVVLTVSGNIAVTNQAGAARFDLSMLKALPATTFKTKTIWTEGEKTFTGVALKTLVDAVGGRGNSLNSVALNDYAVRIPMGDAVEQGPIVAYEMDGQPMSVRDKGPLWIVYPYDANPQYKTEEIYSRSIWQLSRIEILD